MEFYYSKVFRSIVIFMVIFFIPNDIPARTTFHVITLKHIKLIEVILRTFEKDVGRFPNTKEGLRVLITNKDIKDWKGPYLPDDKILTDTWGREYVYIYPARYGGKDFDLYSLGINGKDDHGEADDISNWSGYDEWIYEREDQISAIFLRFSFLMIFLFMGYKIWHKRKAKPF